ncbi:Serine incorporator/TMS membrane protein - like 5 [Theobroma cacao]|nr:Serine incorporator/TMS membrane protein - like 5 [Theobroma cacao]
MLETGTGSLRREKEESKENSEKQSLSSLFCTVPNAILISPPPLQKREKGGKERNQRKSLFLSSAFSASERKRELFFAETFLFLDLKLLGATHFFRLEGVGRCTSEMESGVGGNSNERHGVFKDDSWFSQFRNGSNPWMARYVYALIFLVSNLLAWAVRDYGRNTFPEMEKLKNCQGGRGCLGAEGVLRVSLGCFAFYFVMFLSTAGTKRKYNCRDSWHSGWWSAKIGLWIALTVTSFLVPTFIIQIYGEIAHFGAGIFLLVQLVSVISFITWLNDCCQSDKNAERCHIHVMLLATAAYVICIVGIIMMYIWYAPKPSCLLNIFFITWTLVLLQLMTSVSLHPKVNSGFLSPGLMGLYVVFICWCAIRRHDFLAFGIIINYEPAGESCNRKAEASNKTDWLTIISFVVALLAMVIATFSTGIDSQCFQIRKKEAPVEDAVPYGYGFFHFVFATGAMYFAMLLIGWNTHHTIKKWTIDVGWTSTWVRIVNEWLAVCVYLWMLVAPVILRCGRTSEPA